MKGAMVVWWSGPAKTPARGAAGKAFTMSITCLWAWVAIVLTLPLIALCWATESTDQRVRRLRRYGASQRAIAKQLGISTYRVRKVLA
jgi:hypothetical protein